MGFMSFPLLFLLFRENTVDVQGFVRNAEECKMSCSNDVDCGYFKYFPANDEKQPLFCYHLKKCAPRVIRRSECPLEQNNYIDHFLFVGKQKWFYFYFDLRHFDTFKMSQMKHFQAAF